MQIVEIPTPAGFERPSPPVAEAPPPSEGAGETATPDAPASPPIRSTPSLSFDPHWLAVVKTFAPYLSLEVRQKEFPPVASFDQRISESLDWVKENVGKNGDGMVEVGKVQKFVRTAPATGEGNDHGMRECSRTLTVIPRAHLLARTASWYTNPQTEALCDLLSIPNQINPIPAGFKEAQAAAALATEAAQKAAALAAEEAKKQALADARAEALKQVEEAGTLIDEEPVGEKAEDIVVAA